MIKTTFIIQLTIYASMYILHRMIKTRDYFKQERNEYGETVYVCFQCREHFIEHDGDMITDMELTDHVEETHLLPSSKPDTF